MQIPGKNIEANVAPEKLVGLKYRLDLLQQHLTADEWCLAGGMALRIGFAGREEVYLPDIPVGDVDILVKRPETVHPTITQDLLIAHFHIRTDSGAKNHTYFQLVEPRTGSKIETFDWQEPEEVEVLSLWDTPVSIVSLESQLAATALDLRRVAWDHDQFVDRKQFQEAEALLDLASKGKFDRHKAEVIWRAWSGFHKEQSGLFDLIAQAQAQADAHPELLKETIHADKPHPFPCPECQETAQSFPELAHSYPLASPEEIAREVE